MVSRYEGNQSNIRETSISPIGEEPLLVIRFPMPTYAFTRKVSISPSLGTSVTSFAVAYMLGWLGLSCPSFGGGFKGYIVHLG